MNKKELKGYKLPNEPGIYKFKQGTEILYIGKATNLKSRVSSYFRPDLIKTRGPRLVDMVTKSNNLEFKITDSALEALLLETILIKKLKPKYNVANKDDRSYNHVIITKEDYPRVFLERGRVLQNKKGLPYQIKYVFGPYPSSGSLKTALKIIRKLFPFRDKKSNDYFHDRFYKQIGLSPDTTKSQARKIYQKTINHLRLFFQGKKSKIIKDLEKEMHKASKNLNFELAAKYRNRIHSLKHINDISLLKKDFNLQKNFTKTIRLEAYDIAHTQGQEIVGAMTVAYNNEPEKSEYRLFKIKGQKGADDTKALKEVLERRLKRTEWPYPNIIIVDGGKAQINAANTVINDLDLDIPVVSVVKDEKHKPRDILGTKKIIDEHKETILLLNNEAHRFVLKFHRKKRGQSLFKN